MQFTPWRGVWSIGSIIAIIVLLLAILGRVDVVPLSPHMVFGLIGALALAILL